MVAEEYVIQESVKKDFIYSPVRCTINAFNAGAREGAEQIICKLIDDCKGGVITEEFLHSVYAKLEQ